MLYRCLNHNCPHFAEPCEISEVEYETRSMRYTSPCPVGEHDCFLLVNEENEFFCLIVGSQIYTDYGVFSEKMDKLLQNKLQKSIVLVSDGEDEIGTMTERYAKDKDYQLLIFRADRDTDGKRAGYIRNEKMHKFISEKSDRAVVSFWNGVSKGAAHSFELAKKYDNQIRIIKTQKMM